MNGNPNSESLDLETALVRTFADKSHAEALAETGDHILKLATDWDLLKDVPGLG